MAPGPRRRRPAGLAAQPRSGKRTPEQVELERLRARAERAEAELAQTEAALDVMGQAHAFWERACQVFRRGLLVVHQDLPQVETGRGDWPTVWRTGVGSSLSPKAP